MSRTIKVASIQLAGDPDISPDNPRLEALSKAITQAGEQNADLIVLGGLFNTGKTFLETNYEMTMRVDSPRYTALISRLRTLAKRYEAYIATSFMIFDKDDSYHAGFIIGADDEEIWRYDQRYPLMWERVFYRNGHTITVADTKIGRIGMLIGWDVAHPDLWERYASKIDLMLVLHSEIDYKQAKLRYADGVIVDNAQFSTPAQMLIKHTQNFLQQEIPKQTNWLNVPTISAGCSGDFDSILPAPYFSIRALLFGRATLWRRADTHQQYADMRLIAPLVQYTAIHDASGHILASVDAEGHSIALADIPIADAGTHPPLPLDEAQPDAMTSDNTRLLIDGISAGLLTLNYRRGVRRQWGAQSAPMDSDTRVWLRVVMLVAVISAVLGRLFFSKRP